MRMSGVDRAFSVLNVSLDSATEHDPGIRADDSYFNVILE